MRHVSRIVRIDSVHPIAGADLIEVASVGGWKIVVKKGEFRAGDAAVYFEIDAFLPEGPACWQFLVDKSAAEFEGRRGHVLRTVKLRGQLSQGLLLSPRDFPQLSNGEFELGEDVSKLLDVTKYEKPLPEELWKLARGYFPGLVPHTDEERIQNLAAHLADWQRSGDQGELLWEVTEKLEGESASYAWLQDGLHICTRQLDLLPHVNHPHVNVARELGLEDKLRARFGTRAIVLQGELVGPGIEGNIYQLQQHTFFLYKAYDVQEGQYLEPEARRALADDLGLRHVPLINAAMRIDGGLTMDRLLELAEGPSALRPGQTREGLVYKALGRQVSFKTISNRYLLKQKR